MSCYELPTAVRSFIGKSITQCKLLAVNPAMSTSCEKSFLAAWRLNTWLRSNMTQQRFSNLTLFHWHKKETDKLNVKEIANTFSARNKNRKKNFGFFTEVDLVGQIYCMIISVTTISIIFDGLCIMHYLYYFYFSLLHI